MPWAQKWYWDGGKSAGGWHPAASAHKRLWDCCLCGCKGNWWDRKDCRQCNIPWSESFNNNPRVPATSIPEPANVPHFHMGEEPGEKVGEVDPKVAKPAAEPANQQAEKALYKALQGVMHALETGGLAADPCYGTLRSTLDKIFASKNPKSVKTVNAAKLAKMHQEKDKHDKQISKLVDIAVQEQNKLDRLNKTILSLQVKRGKLADQIKDLEKNIGDRADRDTEEGEEDGEMDADAEETAQSAVEEVKPRGRFRHGDGRSRSPPTLKAKGSKGDKKVPCSQEDRAKPSQEKGDASQESIA